MDKIDWKNEYSTGYELIDNEHKHFFRLINNVISSHNNHYPQDMIDQLLMGLWKYGEEHFISEERLMRGNNYGGSAKHIDDHQHILNEYGNKFQEYNSGNCSLPELIQVLLDWFYGHTVTEDRKLGAFLSETVK